RNSESLLKIADNREFLEAAYRTILRRECDPAGMMIHLEALQRHIPRRVILRRIAQSEEAQSKSGSAVSFWATSGDAELGGQRTFFQKIRTKLYSVSSGLVKRIFLSRFDGIDNRLAFLFEELNAIRVSLSRKTDDSLWSVSEKLDSCFLHLNELQRLHRE